MSHKIYITTPIYYVNDYPHIGHAYTTVAADVLARFYRISGRDVYFLTGTDEHGQKIEKAAKAAGQTPIELADRVVERFKTLWQKLHITHNDFIRTTEDRHKKGAVKLFEKCFEQGDIYPGEYEGWYAVNDEEFLTDTQVAELGDKIKNNPNIIRLKEKTYYFRLSKYQNRLLEHIQNNPHFIQPESRRNEVLRFVEGGLKDLSISRTSFQWGIPVPSDPQHVMYVWFDALSNYLTALGYGRDELWQHWWQGAVHLVGKDILRFHAVFWPAFLMSAGLPLPQTVFAHGWWTIEGEKMSKSKGNFVDPFQFVDEYGADAFRYFLLREFPFGQDGDFAKEKFIARLNSDLANELGNLVSRTVSMVVKYCDSKVPEKPDQFSPFVLGLAQAVQTYEKQLSQFQFDQALQTVWALLKKANQAIDEHKPWAMAKDPSQKQALDRLLYELLSVIQSVSILIYPFMPSMSGQIRQKLGQPSLDEGTKLNYFESCKPDVLEQGVPVEVGAPLFARLESKKV